MENYPKVMTHRKLDFILFIETVKKYPEIYDPSHPSFKQQDDKNGAWNKIAEEFNIDGE
jgi:Alcohol dehydrogenase transcription factor Myb/SANT-like